MKTNQKTNKTKLPFNLSILQQQHTEDKTLLLFPRSRSLGVVTKENKR